jgi:hypothetical protein
MRYVPLSGRLFRAHRPELLSALVSSLALLLAACQSTALVRPDVPVPGNWPR